MITLWTVFIALTASPADREAVYKKTEPLGAVVVIGAGAAEPIIRGSAQEDEVSAAVVHRAAPPALWAVVSKAGACAQILSTCRDTPSLSAVSIGAAAVPEAAEGDQLPIGAWLCRLAAIKLWGNIDHPVHELGAALLFLSAS